MYIIIDDRIQHVGDGMWLSMIKVTIELNYYATSPFDVRCPFHVEKTAVSSSSKHSDWWWTPKKASWRSWNNSWGLDLRPWLVGGLEHEFYDFPYIGNVIIPTDELIFFRWVGQPPTTRCCIAFLPKKSDDSAQPMNDLPAQAGSTFLDICRNNNNDWVATGKDIIPGNFGKSWIIRWI